MSTPFLPIYERTCLLMIFYKNFCSCPQVTCTRNYHTSTKPYWVQKHISLKLHALECLGLSLKHQTVSGFKTSKTLKVVLLRSKSLFLGCALLGDDIFHSPSIFSKK